MLKVRNHSKAGLLKTMFSASLLLCSTAAMAQSQKSGVIKDANGEPLIGVTVLEQGTSNGTVTDVNGRYTLKTTKPNAKLKVSYIGYESQVITPGQSVTLSANDATLNEVVVVGYGTMRRKDVTSSITTVNAKDLDKGVYTDPAQMLQGKVAGLVISSSGDPNGSSSITLRGSSSLREGEAMQPYYVIDGIPGMDISMVAPDDIESIDVLRDATATAIYGSKAANGVIIITTKKGTEGKTNVSYNGYVAFDNALKTLDMASAAELRASGEVVEDEGANTDWQDEVLRTGVSHNHNLSISGGNKQTKYIASLNYIDHDGVIRGTEMNRVNGRALITTKVLKDRLTLSAGINAMRGVHKGVPVGRNGESVLDAMNYYSPTNPVRNEDGSWFKSDIGSQNYNPLSMINEDSNEFEWRRMQYIGKASLNIIDGLVLNANYSYNSKQKVYSYYNSSLSQLPYGGTKGKAHRDTRLGHDQTFETYLNYDLTLAKVHKLSLMAGYSWEERVNNDGFGVSVYNFYNDQLGFKNLAYGNFINGMSDVDSGVEEIVRNISFYGRANYSYDGKYLLQATVRRDGSSVFGANNRWGTFPSVSAAWNIAEESFMKDGIFDQLKLRAGYGVSGNALGFGAYSAYTLFGLNSGSSFTYNGVTYSKIEATQNGNKDLKWETTKMFNVGVDFAFLDSRLSGSIEFYSKKTSDLIWSYDVSTNIYPVGYMNANVGDITNTGIELTINAVPVKTKDFTWQTTVNLAHNKNKVEKLSNKKFSVDYKDWGDPNIGGISSNGEVERIKEGESLGTFWTYEWAGYNDHGQSTYYVHDATTGERTGEVTTTPEKKDKTKVGCALPKVTYGWNNTLTYKKWALTAFFQGNIGNKIMNATRAHYSNKALLSAGKNVLADALKDKYFTSDNTYYYPSDRYLENGSFFRLSTLSLAYTFDNLDGWLKSVQVYGTAKNVFTITGYKGLDPDINLGGLEPGLDKRETFYPHTRSFILGVKVNF
ncbi:MAG: TonB-dependent receptor [Prevotella sp.]|nr:TonB-dependent receptor [Prevotella sp.]MDY4151130.1 TonB-dependent receptor [Prevotella sp.]